MLLLRIIVIVENLIILQGRKMAQKEAKWVVCPNAPKPVFQVCYDEKEKWGT